MRICEKKHGADRVFPPALVARRCKTQSRRWKDTAPSGIADELIAVETAGVIA